jgi:hypothetical protein
MILADFAQGALPGGTSEKRTAKRLGAGVSDVDEEVGEAAGELR